MRGNIACTSVQFPIKDGAFLYQGKLGDDLSTKDGCQAFKLCALNIRSHVHEKIGFENIIALNHLDGIYVATALWDDAPIIVDAASVLMLEVLGAKGTHSRTIYGVHQLPRNFCVGLTASSTLQANVC